jgi:hypothetical protein
MSTVTGRIAWIVAVALVTVAASAERLRRDPFQPPADYADAPSRPDAIAGTRSSRPEIRGILFAGGRSLVNLGGEIIGPGEEASGYLLLEVAEDHAVFRRGDEIVTLSLDPDDDEKKDNERERR